MVDLVHEYCKIFKFTGAWTCAVGFETPGDCCGEDDKEMFHPCSRQEYQQIFKHLPDWRSMANDVYHIHLNTSRALVHWIGGDDWERRQRLELAIKLAFGKNQVEHFDTELGNTHRT